MQAAIKNANDAPQTDWQAARRADAADMPVAAPDTVPGERGMPDPALAHFKHPFARMNTRTLFGAKAHSRDWIYGFGIGLAYLCAGILCLSISRFDASLASVWLPNAIAIAVLFVARLRNELPAFLAIIAASLCANILAGTPWTMALGFIGGNVALIMAVTWLTRRDCGAVPDMSDLAQLGSFLRNGAIIGPVIGSIIAAPSMGPDLGVIATGAFSWFLSESMGLILFVPPFLLVTQIWRGPGPKLSRSAFEAVAICALGLATVILVLSQSTFSLLFLVPLITLFIALRLGAVGTALFVPALAIVTCGATVAGLGPMAETGFNDVTRVNVLQAFIAANFLTGLPIAAILAGRKRLTDQLESGRRELALMSEGITDAVLIFDDTGVCTYASPSVQTVLGRPKDQFIGRYLSENTHQDAHDRIVAVFDSLLSGKSDKERITYRRFMDGMGGQPVFIEADCAVLLGMGAEQDTGDDIPRSIPSSIPNSIRSSIVVSARDVTERVELELLLTRARKSAEDAASAKSEFLANMSHEIRTPMNGVLGFAELLREADLSDENRRHADMIVQSGRSMMMLLNDILDLSKIEAGQVGIANEPVDLLATITECAALYRPSAEKKGLELDFSITQANADLTRDENADAKSPWIKTDGLRLRQIILNLVGNAIKFTENGGVSITVSGDEEELYIAVRDTGIGISEKRLKSIFAPFTQGEGDTARRYGGTGLGLSISRQLAELLGGTIDVQSEAGEGSTFRLTLPATYTEPALPEPAAEEPFEPSTLPQSASILLVEDHDVNRMLVSEMLERCGQSVATAHDGNEAIAMVIDSIMRAKPFDLVLMDIQMPGCDGYAATRAIRMEGITPDELPIIALTANAFPEDIVAAREAGMQAHLAKPLVFADLARALQRWLPTRIIDNDDASEELQDAGAGTLEEDEEPSPRSSPPTDDATYESASTLRAPIAGSNPAQSPAEIVDISRDPCARPPKIGEAQLPEAHMETEPASSLSQFHSPSLIKRWTKRRSEAVEAVRGALEDGSLGEDGRCASGECEPIAKLVHKLAGTAAIFGEAELGDQAAALEHALRMRLPGDVREALAFELLSVADDPSDTVASLGR